eukprot:8758377-Alexandrium_andersonii.AAC.1
MRGEQPGKTRLDRLAAVHCSAGRPPGHPLAPRDGTRAVKPRAARPWGPAAAALERPHASPPFTWKRARAEGKT